MPAHESIANPFTAYGESVMRGRNTLKWRQYGPDVLPLWVAEMDTDPAPEIVEAVQRALRNGETGYPVGTALQEAFAAFASDRWGWAVTPQDLVEVTDVMTGVGEALRLLTDPGDAVIINPPVYPPFGAAVRHAGRRVVPAPLDAAGRLDFATLEEAFDRSTPPGTRAAYLLCSPHNPTGVVHTADELRRVAELAERYGVRVVVDEVHAPITYGDQPFRPYLSVPGSESAFAVVSAAKAWNIAGLKSALLVPGSAALADARRLPDVVRYAAGSVGMVAHAAAFTHGTPWLEQHLRGLAENRERLTALVAELLPGVRFRPPAATYLGWLDCRALELTPDPATVFLDQARVALSGGDAFGAGGEGFVRLNFAVAPATLEAAVSRMAGVLA